MGWAALGFFAIKGLVWLAAAAILATAASS
jgi:hypothetical protein